MRGSCLRSRVATVLRLQQQRRLQQQQQQQQQQLSRKAIASSSVAASDQLRPLRPLRPQQQLHVASVPASAPSHHHRQQQQQQRRRDAATMKAHASAEGAPENNGSDKRPRRPPPTRVLLTNDDGPLSPFFIAWVSHVRSYLSWQAFVAPPAEGQSFVSKAVATGNNHASDGKSSGIFLTRVDEETVHVSGPPATAVNLALHHLAPDCDFVVSGPNIGHNVGRGSVLSSGTVGAALEGAVAGRRSVALSFPFRHGFNNWTDEELRLAVEASGRVVADLWENWGEGVDLYNVNVPLDFNRSEGGGERILSSSPNGGRDGAGGASSPFEVRETTVDSGAQYASLYKLAREDADHDFEWGPSGLRVFDGGGADAVAGGDVEAVREGKISVTALRAALAHVETSSSR